MLKTADGSRRMSAVIGEDARSTTQRGTLANLGFNIICQTQRYCRSNNRDIDKSEGIAGLRQLQELR